MSNDYPRMIFKAPGPEEFHGGHFDTRIIEHDEDLASALAEGWRLSTPEATALYEESQKPAAVVQNEPEKTVHAKPITTVTQAEAVVDHAAERAALKSEAAELKLTFPKNIPTDKLHELVATAKNPAPAAEGEE